MKRDKALESARELVNNVVCECGHWDSEHHTDPVLHEHTHCGECGCKKFRSVAFDIKRSNA